MGGSAAAARGGRCLRATVAYDGTDFSGFQIQASGRTVQGVLEEGLKALTQEDIRVVGAGRTDSGVHALGQVVSFCTGWCHSIEDLERGWNAVLPRDVAVRDVGGVERWFHPRFDARSRVYRYTIWVDRVRNPLVRRTSHWVQHPLDVAAMEEASRLLLGEHDFATFGAPPQGSNTIRRVLQASWTRQDSTLYLDIEANAFLYRMVRSIVGTLLQVGTGDLSVGQFASLFGAADRSLSGPTAAANGLCLMAVKY